MSFTYQLDNFREMKQFVEFGRRFNVDFVIFERLQNLGAYSWDEFRSKAVHLTDHPLHGEFLAVVRDPVFGRQMVWHDFEWEGVVVLSDKDVSARMEKRSSDCKFVGADRYMNDLANFRDVFRGITPYSGTPPKGFLVDFLGTLLDSRFRLDFNGNPETDGGQPVTTRLPVIEDGEGWFEAVNWVEAARAARDRYVTSRSAPVTAGKRSAPSVRSLRSNPMPYRLVAVEPELDNMKWLRKHFADNGIDPDRQWLLQTAISGSNEPVYFPVGSPGSGAQNCFSTNDRDARASYFDYFVKSGTAVQALEAILMQGTTGIKKDLVPGMNLKAGNQVRQFDHIARRVGNVRHGRFPRGGHAAVRDRGVSPLHGNAQGAGSPCPHRNPWWRRACGTRPATAPRWLDHRVRLCAQFEIRQSARQVLDERRRTFSGQRQFVSSVRGGQ